MKTEYLIGILAVIAVSLVALGKIELPGQATVALPTGCQDIGTTTVTADSYTCDAGVQGKCEVIGTLSCTKQSGVPAVSGRVDSSWAAIDVNSDGKFEYFTAASSINCLHNAATQKCATNGYCLSTELVSGTGTYVCMGPSTSAYGKKGIASNVPAGQELKVSTSTQSSLAATEVYTSGSGYSCKWGLCEPTRTNEYCTKTESSSTAWTKSSPALLISTGELVSFKPTDPNGILLTTGKSMQVTKYNCETCTDDGNVCTTDVKIGTQCAHTPIEGCCKDNSGCSPGFNCAANKCVAISGYCDSGKPCSDALKQCVANVCQCTATNSCTAGTSKCSGSTVLQCIQQPSSECYKWAVSGIDCSSTQKICQSGQCMSVGDFNIVVPSSVGLNKPITVTATVSGGISNAEGATVTYQILDAQSNALTTFYGTLTKDLATGNYISQETYQPGLSIKGDYRLKGTVSIAGNSLTSTKTISVYTGARVTIYAPQTVFYSHLPGLFYVKVLADDGTLVSKCSAGYLGTCFDNLLVTVKVGGQTMQTSVSGQTEPDGSTKVEFYQSSAVKSINNVGSVYIEAKTSGGQIATVSGTDSNMKVEAPIASIIFDYPDKNEVKYGVNTFTFSIVDNLNNKLNVPTQAININVKGNIDWPTTGKYITPSGINGEYSFTVDMPENKGDSYYISVSAQYSNWPIASIPNIPIRAVGEIVPPFDYTWIIIGGLAIVLVVVVLVVRRR